jgi:DNA-binding IclR family transcriptional regulator
VADGNDRSHDGPLDRAIAILTFVAEQRKALSAAEIAVALSLPLPTAHRLIGNLESRGLIQKALGTKRYVVGSKLVALSAKAIEAAFRTTRRHAVLRAVADQIGEQCEIGVVRDNEVVYVDSVRSRQSQGLQFDPGGAAPLHCTSTGKIYMSRLPLKARHRLVHSLPLVRHTPNTITDPDELMAQLEETRRKGWAKTNEEFVRGVVGCAVPIVSPAGDLIACLGVSVPVARVQFADLDAFIGPLQRAATLLSETILQDNLETDNSQFS